MVMLLILAGAWVYAASDSFQNHGQGPSRDMWGNAIAQLPNLPAVTSYVFRDRFWLPLVVLVTEAMALGFGIFIKKVERDLNAPRWRSDAATLGNGHPNLGEHDVFVSSP